MTDKVGGGSIEFDTWCSLATGTKLIQLPLGCCPGAAEKQPRDMLMFMVILLNQLFKVKSNHKLLKFIGVKSKEHYFGLSLAWLDSFRSLTCV